MHALRALGIGTDIADDETLMVVFGTFDMDGDGTTNWADNCKWMPNPDQADSNGDGAVSMDDNYNIMTKKTFA